MKDSGYDSNTAIIEHRASGYSPSPKGPVNAGYIHMSVPYAAGALYSTTEDLLRWEQGLFGGRILSPASLAKMIAPFKNDYALGVVVQTSAGGKVVQHGGGIEGFNTFLAYYPDDKLTIAVLANINGPTPNAIAAKLATVAHGGPVKTIGERIEIALAQLSGQPTFPIFAESSTVFFYKVVDATLEFQTDPAGATTGVRLRH